MTIRTAHITKKLLKSKWTLGKRELAKKFRAKATAKIYLINRGNEISNFFAPSHILQLKSNKLTGLLRWMGFYQLWEDTIG